MSAAARLGDDARLGDEALLDEAVAASRKSDEARARRPASQVPRSVPYVAPVVRGGVPKRGVAMRCASMPAASSIARSARWSSRSETVQNVQPRGGVGQLGSGIQSSSGAHDVDGTGHPGGALKRTDMSSPLTWTLREPTLDSTARTLRPKPGKVSEMDKKARPGVPVPLRGRSGAARGRPRWAPSAVGSTLGA